MNKDFYPDEIQKLPEADVPFSGVRAWLLQSEHGQLVFFGFTRDVEVPAHQHGAQWGVVVDGEIVLTIADQTKTYRRGDSYFIPANTKHSALVKSGARVIDFFADPHRYRAKLNL